jgi:DNA-binding winged helix-turn-helix (wHTH) protein
MVYEFGLFRFDAGDRLDKLMWAETKHMVLPPHKALVLLRLFLENPGKLFTREQLRGMVWHDTHVHESTVTKLISVLRKTLDETPKDRKYIETLAGDGYRFVADVKLVGAALQEPSALRPRPRDLHGQFFENAETGEVSEVYDYCVAPLVTVDPNVTQEIDSLEEIINSPSFKWPVGPETYEKMTSSSWCRRYRT